MNGFSQLTQETQRQEDLLWEHKAVTGNQMLGWTHAAFSSLTEPLAITDGHFLLWSQGNNPFLRPST